MHRIDHSTAAGALPAPDAAGAPGFFTKGDPQTAVPATIVTADWANATQEELAYVIEQAGLVLSKTDHTQLRAAILSMIQSANSAVIIIGATFAAGVADGNVVRWDSGAGNFAKAIADGTTNDLAVGFADVTNSKVYCYGETPALFAGLTPGAKYYLDGTTAGAITTVRPSDGIIVGIAKSATTIFVDIYSDPAASQKHFVPVIAARGLNITNDGVSPNSKLAYTATEAIVRNASYNPQLLFNLALSADIAVAGAGGLDTGVEAASTWYHVWLIYNPTTSTSALVLSVSSVAPTLPSGYTEYSYQGAVYNDAASNFISFEQVDREASYKNIATIIDGAITASAWTAINVGAFFPPTARRIKVGASISSSAGFGLSPNSNGFGGAHAFAGAAAGTVTVGVFPTGRNMIASFDIAYKGSSIYYYFGSTPATLIADGWSYA